MDDHGAAAGGQQGARLRDRRRDRLAAIGAVAAARAVTVGVAGHERQAQRRIERGVRRAQRGTKARQHLDARGIGGAHRDLGSEPRGRLARRLVTVPEGRARVLRVRQDVEAQGARQLDESPALLLDRAVEAREPDPQLPAVSVPGRGARAVDQHGDGVRLELRVARGGEHAPHVGRGLATREGDRRARLGQGMQAKRRGVPSDPVNSLGRSNPATFLTTLPPARACVPSARTKETPMMRSRAEP